MPCCELHPRVMTAEEEQRELEDPLQWLPPGQLERMSQVAGFYQGASVFLTGVTGFIGTLILEKLLRSCPGLSRVYVLVRDKKGVPLRERLQSHLDKVVFSKARKACPDYLRKVVPIAGDCAQPGLGISTVDIAELCTRVSIVFHLAATVRFDADLRTATLTNVASTYDMLAITRRMTNLKAFVYMSTAFSHHNRSEIREIFYPPGLNAEDLLKLINNMDDEQLSQILPLVLGDWPNTYTFTKAVAEDVVRNYGIGLPVSIIRPSIVVSTSREPLALWANSVMGAIGMWMGGAAGLIHTMQIDYSVKADLVPADFVANATIACAFDTWRTHKARPLVQMPSADPVIYNYTSSPRHPVTWKNVFHFGKVNLQYPTIKSIWCAFDVPFKQELAADMCAILVHLFPAIIVDSALHLMRKKPMLWTAYSKVHVLSQVLVPFTTREWTFKDDNVVSLLEVLKPADHKLFPFDIRDIDWEWFLGSCLRGCRLYILNDNFDNLEQARRKQRRFRMLHYTLLSLVCALLSFILYKMLTEQVVLRST